MIKKFESFDNEKSWKYIIVGIPSGEVLEVSSELLDILYGEGLVKYNVKYIDSGFYSFDDKNYHEIINKIDTKNIKSNNNSNVHVENNQFNNGLIRDMLDMVKDIKDFGYNIDFFVQKNFMIIIYNDYYLEVTLNKVGTKYDFMKRYKSTLVDKYKITNDSNLYDRLAEELLEITKESKS